MQTTTQKPTDQRLAQPVAVSSALFGEVARCRWCEKTKPLADMAVASWKGREYNGVCRECMTAPDAEQREAAYLMRDMPNTQC